MEAANSVTLARIPFFSRFVADQAIADAGMKNNRELVRKFEDAAAAQDEAKRSQGFYRALSDWVIGTDNSRFPVLFVRTVTETKGISDTIRQWGDYIRGLYDEAGSLAGTIHQGEYHRRQEDAVQAKGSLLRSLSIFVRILTASFVRDYVLQRFVNARDQIKLKSCITREITLESRID
jgi:hypothetical protein